MLMIEIVILIISVIVSAATGLFVFARNPYLRVNRIYGLLTIALILFSVANYLSLKSDDQLFYMRLVIALSTIIVTSLYFLVVSVGSEKRFTSLQRSAVAATVMVTILDLTPIVFKGVTSGETAVPVPNIGIPLFVIHLISFLSLGVGLLIKRVLNASGASKIQYGYMLAGVLPIFLFAPITGVVMPIVFQNASLIVLSPVYGAIFVCSIGYAIVRHRLFDVRPVVARSLAYVGALAFIAVVYGFVVFGILRLVTSASYSFSIQLVLSLTTGAAVLIFSRFKIYFDRATNRLFYQDAYNPQELFDEYNKALVSTIDLDVMLHETSRIISKYLQTEYCVVGVKDGTDAEFRISGTVDLSFDRKDISRVRKITPHIRRSVILTDELASEYSSLKTTLQKYNIAMLVRLTSDFKESKEGEGYIAISPKKSGNLFTKQDVQVIEAVANELIIALQNALRFEEIERFNETLQRQVEDATRKLKASNLKLKKLNDTKDDFISMTSHQLRTPLTTIKGYVSLVMDEDAGPVNDAQRKLLTQAFGSAQRLVYMVADLLNVSRLKTGKFVIERTPTDLSTIIDDELEQLKAEASLRNLKLEYKMPKKFPILPLDETKTRQVIMNFLDNAIYYTPSGGKIRAELVEKDDSVEFLVIDNGIGVPKEERHHLFSKFYRAKNAQRARPDGTGLGLYMAQKVVVAQGGYIIFNSEEGKGSTFGFHFPKDMPEGQVALPAQAPSGRLDG